MKDEKLDEKFALSVIEHLGPEALANGKISAYDAFERGWDAALASIHAQQVPAGISAGDVVRIHDMALAVFHGCGQEASDVIEWYHNSLVGEVCKLPPSPASTGKVEAVAWQYRWLNPDNSKVHDYELQWKPVEPRGLSEVEDRIRELQAYRYNGKPVYEVRALGVIDTHPAPAPVAQAMPADWAVFNSGACVADNLPYDEALEYMTPARLERGWTMVCVINKDNPPPLPAAPGSEPAQGEGRSRDIRFIATADGRSIDDDDFTHDARLDINGDFGDDKSRRRYAESLCALLNAQPAQLKRLTDRDLRTVLTGSPTGHITDTVRGIANDVQQAIATANGVKLEG